jgi:hypothetical protein
VRRHTDIATTQRYARVNTEKIGSDMKLLSARLAGKFPFQSINQPTNNQFIQINK